MHDSREQIWSVFQPWKAAEHSSGYVYVLVPDQDRMGAGTLDSTAA